MRIVSEKQCSDGLRLVELYANSSEEKSDLNYASGSKITEIDTGNIYIFDEVSRKWYLQPKK